MKILKIIKNNKNGFTLIETMVAIVILSMALIPVLALISNSLFISRYSVNEITTNYLLQEIVDYVKNDMDTQILNNKSWDDETKDAFWSKYGSCKDKCTIDVSTDEVNSCNFGDYGDGQGNCIPLGYNEDRSGGSFYNYNDDSSPSNFTRTIIMEENDQGVKVEVSVSFKNGGQDGADRERNLTFYIVNWR